MSRAFIATIAFAAIAFQSTNAQAGLLLDFFGGVDPTTHQDWADAGVIGDTSTFAGGTISGGGVFNITGGLTATASGNFPFNGNAFNNGMLTDYLAVQNATGSVVLGGFENVLTSTLGDMNGNTFAMLPSTDYVLTLFGAGDSDGQDTLFTFNGLSQATSPTIVGTAADGGHSVDFAFTTPSDLTGYTLAFDFQNNTSAFAAFNGAAITASAVPEPSSLAILAGTGLIGLVRQRRKRNRNSA